MSIIYCTIIDESYVPRALVLRDSIMRHSPSAYFSFYCADNAAADMLDLYARERTYVVRPEKYETSELRAIKCVSKLSEYCWTCKPAILIHAMQSDLQPQWVVWLDSDMMAYGDIGITFDRYSDASVVLSPHRSTLPKFAAYEPIVGKFNAGFVAFQTSNEGREALDWWMVQCLQGCPAEPDGSRYADQKYLNSIPSLFPNAVASDSPGLNCAPWNVFGRDIVIDGNRVTVDGEPLLLYHFQGLKIIRSWAYDLYGAQPALPKLVRGAIYRQYLHALSAQIRDCAARVGRPLFGIDYGFAGLAGLFTAAKRMRWCPNLVLKI